MIIDRPSATRTRRSAWLPVADSVTAWSDQHLCVVIAISRNRSIAARASERVDHRQPITIPSSATHMPALWRRANYRLLVTSAVFLIDRRYAAALRLYVDFFCPEALYQQQLTYTVVKCTECELKSSAAGNVSIGGLVGGAYCVFVGRMGTAKSYLWLIQFKTKMR